MLTLTHKQNIISIMLKTTQEYIAFCMYEPDGESMNMYARDVAYNANALSEFTFEEDYAQLHTAIIRQDTFVREYYYAVLVYIEQNALIPKHKFACI